MGNIFQRIGKGVKTTFGIKELTPQQRADIETKKLAEKKRVLEEQAYKQTISERQKQAWQVAYQQELAKQRLLYGAQKEREAMARGVTKAQQEVQALGKPKPKMAWLSALGTGVAKIMPTPPQKVQRQLDASLELMADKRAKPKAITPTSPVSSLGAGAWDIPLSSGRKGKQANPMKAGMWDVPMSKPVNQFTAQSMEHRLGKHLKHKHHIKPIKHHLKHLGTMQGGVNVSVDGTQVTLASRKQKLKNPRQASDDMFWKL